MPGTLITWLEGVGSTAFTLSAVAFVVLNAAGVSAVFLTRDRGFVNRWTSRFLAANLVLLGTGLGIPLAAMVTRTAIAAITPSFMSSASADQDQPVDELQTGRRTR